MLRTVRFSRKADAQLRSLRRYLLRRSTPAIALRYTAEIAARCQAIVDVPEGGTPRPDLGPDLRSVAFKARVTIVYRLSAPQITIAGIFYGGQDLTAHFPQPQGS